MSPLTEKQSRAIAVARDVIETIRSKQGYRVVNGSGYIHMELPQAVDFSVKRNTELQSILPAIGTACEVCMDGALFLSMIRLYDNFMLSDCDVERLNDKARLSFNKNTIVNQLDGTFSYYQLSLVECAFEMSELHFGSLYDYLDDDADIEIDDIRAAIWFGGHFFDPEERAIAICENMIANNGTFVPPEAPAAYRTDLYHMFGEDEDDEDDDYDDYDEDDEDEDEALF